jgi:DNA-nicking Smr family endonuclease
MNGKDTETDKALFLEEMADVTPLAPETIEPHKKKRRPEPIPQPTDEPEDKLVERAVETPDFLEFRRPGVQHRVFADLGRGVIASEATLDLHGMHVVEARKALLRFLDQAVHRHHRCVRIIHGKGRGSDKQPVLKHKINQWLPQRDEVLAFSSAPRWDGGTGAVYVLLSKKAWL